MISTFSWGKPILVHPIKSSIPADVLAIAHSHNKDHQSRVMNLVQDPKITDTDAPDIFRACEPG